MSAPVRCTNYETAQTIQKPSIDNLLFYKVENSFRFGVLIAVFSVRFLSLR